MRAFVALLTILAVVCLAGTTAATAQAPTPVSPTSAIALLEWCWDQRDPARYRELFTGDFRFEFAPGDSAGDRYPDRAWARDDELAGATQLFTGGGEPEPAATGIALALDGTSPPGTLHIPGMPYPWHQQILVPSHTLDVTRADGSTLRSTGQSLFYLVRGDSAVLPQELIERGFSPDSSRWYIERWVDVPDPAMVPEPVALPDRPPVVSAPDTVSGRVGTAIAFILTAVDPDGDPIERLSAASTTSATFIPSANNSSAGFTWVPVAADTGVHRVTFTATNALSASATTVITVQLGNLPPTATIAATPMSGVEPLAVTFDASGSTDLDGTITSYRFNFDDGTIVRGGPVATHTFGAGLRTAIVSVTDNLGAVGTATATITVSQTRTDRSPVVTAPATVDGRAGSQILVNVTALDPDNDPIASLTATSATSATFTTAANHTSGTFTWIPAASDTGTHPVAFTATNALTGSANTLVVVRPANLPPVASCLATPASGSAPLQVTFDASGSRDPDGRIVNYHFHYGDGAVATQASPVATHTFTQGNFTVWVTVTDDLGATDAITVVVFAGAANRSPVVSCVASPTSGVAPLHVRVDASGSRDPDGSIVSYRFAFGDGTVVTQAQSVATHTYAAGDRTVTVTATDNLGASASASASIRVNAGPSGASSDVVALLEQCWDNRDPARYRELFTGDFRFEFAPGDSAGDPYPDRAWTRDDELASATQLFTGGGAPEPAVTGIGLALSGSSPPGTLLLPGMPYPWHQQILVPSHTLDVTRADGSALRSTGQSLFYLVRGDSAMLPQELIERGFMPDSSRWYIERWVDMPDPQRVPDAPPVVTAPAAITGRVGTPIVVDVTAFDPNQHEITSLIATGAAAAFFSVRSFNTAGTVAWVPQMGDVGTHSLTFTATNALTGTAVTLVTVLPPIQHPVASLVVSPSSGSEPLVVTLDASGSSDSNGSLVSYRFDFGDGSNVTQTHPVTSHSYRAGSWLAFVTVTDDEGGTNSISQRIAVAASSVQPNLVGNPSFEVDTRGWRDYAGSVVARILGGFDGAYALQATGPEVMAGSFGVNDSPDWIKPTTAAGRRYRFAAWVRSPSSHGTAKLRVTEYLLATKARLGQVTSVGKQLSPEWQLIQVDYTTMSAGSSLDFHVRDFPVVPGEVLVTDNLSIRDITGVAGIVPAEGEFEMFAEEGPPLQPTLYPSPVQSVAVLSFATSQAGALRVEILDLAGRRVRRLADEAEASPGMHVLPVHGTGDDGRRLSPGVYFYRIETPEGAKTGRFVVLK